MSLEPKLAAAMSGVTLRQLRYWRSQPAPILTPEVSASRPILYSFRDVIALRTFAALRDRWPLQKIRRALDTLDKLGEREHLSEYRLVGDAHSIYLAETAQATDLLKRPGQTVIVEVVEVLKPYYTRGRHVPDLFEPREHIRQNPGIRGGEPVIAGTRIPAEYVAGLIRDGVPPDEIASFYPSVDAAAATEAADYADYIDSYTNAA